MIRGSLKNRLWKLLLGTASA